MTLVQPTDYEILELLSEEGRNTAANLALELDKDRGYVNTRLPSLEEHGFVEKVGPAPNSGLYQITPKGERALADFHPEEAEPSTEG